MAKLIIFTLPKVLLEKDPNIRINGMYPFKDGRLCVTETIGRQIRTVLTRLYQCTESVEDVTEEPVIEGGESSLAKALTKGAPVESKPAATAIVHPKPDPNAPRSVTPEPVKNVEPAKAVEQTKK